MIRSAALRRLPATARAATWWRWWGVTLTAFRPIRQARTPQRFFRYARVPVPEAHALRSGLTVAHPQRSGTSTSRGSSGMGGHPASHRGEPLSRLRCLGGPLCGLAGRPRGASWDRSLNWPSSVDRHWLPPAKPGSRRTRIPARAGPISRNSHIGRRVPAPNQRRGPPPGPGGSTISTITTSRKLSLAVTADGACQGVAFDMSTV